MRIALLLLVAVLSAAAASDRGEYFSTSSGPVTITLIHHASMVIDGAGKTVYVDPTGEGNYKGLHKPDLILITNDQPDHFDMAAIKHFVAKNTAVIAPAGVAQQVARSTAVGNGETVRLDEIVIEAEPAYQATPPAGSGPVHEKGKGNGYVLTYPGLRVYISGDTGFYPEMKGIKNIDVAFLSVGTPDTMSIDDATQAIHLIKPRFLYPYHFRDTNPDDLRKQLATAGVEVRVRNWY